MQLLPSGYLGENTYFRPDNRKRGNIELHICINRYVRKLFCLISTLHFHAAHSKSLILFSPQQNNCVHLLNLFYTVNIVKLPTKSKFYFF